MDAIKSGLSAGLAVTLEVAEPVVVGLSVLATIRVFNTGGPVVVSSRLNLTEGDVHLVVERPESGTCVIKGWQADTALRRVTLQPGEHIAGGINLLHTDAGPTFPESGKYMLRAVFTPSPIDEPVTSPSVSVTARLPRSGPEHEVAAMLEDEALREAVVLAKYDSAPVGLSRLAAGPVGVLDTELARWIISGNGSVGGPPEPVTLIGGADAPQMALAITTLCSPYSNVGKRLTEKYAARFERQEAVTPARHVGDADPISAAVRILRGRPLSSQCGTTSHESSDGPGVITTM